MKYIPPCVDAQLISSTDTPDLLVFDVHKSEQRRSMTCALCHLLNSHLVKHERIGINDVCKNVDGGAFVKTSGYGFEYKSGSNP